MGTRFSLKGGETTDCCIRCHHQYHGRPGVQEMVIVIPLNRDLDRKSFSGFWERTLVFYSTLLRGEILFLNGASPMPFH